MKSSALAVVFLCTKDDFPLLPFFGYYFGEVAVSLIMNAFHMAGDFEFLGPEEKHLTKILEHPQLLFVQILPLPPFFFLGWHTKYTFAMPFQGILLLYFVFFFFHA